MDWGDIAGSSGFQVGYPLLSALLAASGQRGANVAQGLNTGMVIANRYGEQRKADEQNKLLGQSLGSILKATTPVSSTSTVASQPVNASTAQFSMPQPDDQIAAPPASVPLEKQTTTTQQPMYSPQAQKLGEALINARQPGLLLPTLMKEAIRDPKLTPVRPGGALVDEQGNVKYQAPAPPPREVTPPRPVIGTQGGEGVTTSYNPTTKQWEEKRQPLTAAPARLLSPEDQRLKELYGNRAIAQTKEAGAQTGTAAARTGEINARTERLKQITADLKNPSTAKNLDKLTTIASELRRQRKDIADRIDSDSPENVQRLTDLDAVLDDTVKKQAAAVRDRGGTNQVGLPGAGGGTGTAPPPTWKAVGKDPASGKTVYEDPAQIDPKTKKPKRFVAN